MNPEVKKNIDKIFEIYKSGGIKSDAARFIRKVTSLKRTQSQKWASILYDEYKSGGGKYSDKDSNVYEGRGDTEIISDNSISDNEEKKFFSDLEFSDKYIYNKATDSYIFLLERALGKNIVISGNKVKSIIKLYSNYDSNPQTINQVATKHCIPRNVLIRVLRILGITHDSIPVTIEELETRSVEDIVDECIEDKRFALHQKLQKRGWLETQEDARKWNEFVQGNLNPLCDFLDRWEPPEYNIGKYRNTFRGDSVSDDEFLCIVSDTHIGEWTKHTFNGEVYNTEIAIKRMTSYLLQIEDRLSNMAKRPHICNVVFLGDILNSCLDGMTRRGTNLSNDIINEDLFDVGLDIISSFIDGLLDIFGKVYVQSTKGNHDSILIYGIYGACKKYFSKNPYVRWNNSKYWLNSFKINNNYFIYTHGNSDENNVSIPKGNNKNLESFIQSLLLSRINELQGVTSKYFITGHLHNFRHIENNDFEFIQVPSLVGSGDSYSESLGYLTKARQNSFIVGKNYIKETLHFYF